MEIAERALEATQPLTFTRFAKVVLDQAIDKPLDYGIPPSLEAAVFPGSRVSIPVRGRLKKGTVLSIETSSQFATVQPIDSLLSDKETLSPDLFKLADWISEYYCCSLNKALLSMLPASVRKDIKDKTQALIQRSGSIPKLIEICDELRVKFPKQAAVLDVVLQHPNGLFISELLEYPGITKGPIETLIKKGILTQENVSIDRSLLEDEEFLPTSAKILTPEQSAAFEGISQSLQEGQFQTHLVHGVTGSGKTELYLRSIDAALSLSKQVIMLVPEISLTRQTIEHLKGRFQKRIAILHHRLSDGERFDAWHAIRRGEIPIVVGARSAIFSPLPNLGLIIVDEEHESSYKQMDDQPCYHARDLAVVRGKFTSATVVLGSATPSLESFVNAQKGKYILHKLTKRASGELPQISIVNMKHECDKAKGFTLFSDLLLKKLKERIEVGEQSILFLNRRGYFNCQVCTSCKQTVMCEHCDVSLTYHRGFNILSCHICGWHKPAPIESCPSCKQETLKYQGPGTEQVERALHAIFPEVRTLRMDRDTTRHKGSHDRIFQEFKTGKADVLIGTQMIAKGLHFPLVTLVSVLGADSSLYIPDFRANEHTFQLISQVSGRSGRGQMPGEVVIQSFLFDHPTIELAAKNDYETFAAKELLEREEYGYPPFSRLVKIVFSSKDLIKLQTFAGKYHALLKRALGTSAELQPLTPCGHAKIKDRHRFQCIIRTKNIQKVAHILKHLPIVKPHHVHLLIDIDAMSTFS